MREKINLNINNIDANIYRKFQTALGWFKEDETATFEKFMMDYSNSFIKSYLDSSSPNEAREEVPPKSKSSEKKSEKNAKSRPVTLAASSDADERRRLFVEWFGTQEKDGKPYGKRTIELYANKLANACKNQEFDQIPIKNLFEISDYAEFKQLVVEIRNSPKFAEFCRKAPGMFSSSLSKYSEFLKYLEKNPSQITYDFESSKG